MSPDALRVALLNRLRQDTWTTQPDLYVWARAHTIPEQRIGPLLARLRDTGAIWKRWVGTEPEYRVAPHQP